MDNRKLEALIGATAEVLEGRDGAWVLRYHGEELIVISDETHDRVRVMAPVAEETALTATERLAALTANFDRTLDARYALGRGKLWAVYLHPLGDLTERQFRDALEQVRRLKTSFGSGYTSSDLVFRGGT